MACPPCADASPISLKWRMTAQAACPSIAATVITSRQAECDEVNHRSRIMSTPAPLPRVVIGATHSYFGHDEWAAHAPGLKTLADALHIRQRLLYAFELAEREAQDAAARESWLTFAVVGAGPTGVEMAGTLAEIAHHTLHEEYRRIDSRRARVVLLEGAPRVLGAFPETLSQRAREQLDALGVEVRTGAQVTHIDDHGVRFRRG